MDPKLLAFFEELKANGLVSSDGKTGMIYESELDPRYTPFDRAVKFMQMRAARALTLDDCTADERKFASIVDKHFPELTDD